MVCRSRFPALATAALAAAFLAAAVPAGAVVKKFYPVQFKEQDNLQDSYRSPANIGSRSGNSLFWAPLSLPVGAVVTGLSYRHSGTGGAPQTTVQISYDVTNDEPQNDPSNVVYGTSSAVTGIPPTIKVVGSVGSLPHAIKASRRYWVGVICAAGSAVWQVDVTYNEP